MDTEIRKATKDDVPKVLSLGKDVEEFVTSDHEDMFWPESVLHKGVESDEVIFLVAIQNNQVVGFTIVNCNRALSKALIENLFVAPTARGSGVGTLLVGSSLKTIRNQGYRYVSTLISPNNTTAIKTYESVGFGKGNVFLWLDLLPDK